MDAQLATRESEIWQLHLLGVPKTKIAERLGLHRNTVASIVSDIKEKAASDQTASPSAPDGKDEH